MAAAAQRQRGGRRYAGIDGRRPANSAFTGGQHCPGQGKGSNRIERPAAAGHFALGKGMEWQQRKRQGQQD